MRFPLVLLISLLLINCQSEPAQLRDVDGNLYRISAYGDRMWMTENLRTQHDRSGEPIPTYLPGADARHVEAYGLLYDFETACKVCPSGWRLPTNAEWEALFGWEESNVAAPYKDPEYWGEDPHTHSSLFSIRPAGSGNNGEYPDHFGEKTLFWSQTKEDDHFVWTYILEKGQDSIRQASQHPTYAFSVRCIQAKDQETAK